MDEALKAHERLQALLRDSIRTHHWTPVDKNHGYKRTKAEEEELGRRLKEMESRGIPRKQMKINCGCTGRTLIKHLGLLKPKKEAK